MPAIPLTVVVMSGRVCSIVASLVVPLALGGGRWREVGVLGIQPPYANYKKKKKKNQFLTTFAIVLPC